MGRTAVGRGMIMGGRQFEESLERIRDDHKARYRAAGAYFRKMGARRVLDAGCGCGYGAFIMASEFGLEVVAIDTDTEALTFAEHHYRHVKVTHLKASAVDAADVGKFAGAVALEVLEHIEDAPAALTALHVATPLLFGSVPNQAVIPFDRARHPAHVRHYTTAEIQAALKGAGWTVRYLGGQRGKRDIEAQILPHTLRAATLVFAADR